MPSVPDTTTFSLQDVYDTVHGHATATSNDLNSCLSNAVAGYFDSRYTGYPANSLLRFRNYTVASQVTITTSPNVGKVVFVGNNNTMISLGGTVTVTNQTILEKGVVWSSSNEVPTVNDNGAVHSNTSSGNFYINISNAFNSQTIYYFRTYVITNTGTYYGDGQLFTFLKVGDYAYGGLVTYIFTSSDIGYESAYAQHGIIVSSNDITTNTWDVGFHEYVPGTAGDISYSRYNTDLIVSSVGDSGTYAARTARNYNNAGYTDWGLPAINELYYMYMGSNFVPYDTGLTGYWSSSDYDDNNAYKWYFTPGNSGGVFMPKAGNGIVRPIRYF